MRVVAAHCCRRLRTRGREDHAPSWCTSAARSDAERGTNDDAGHAAGSRYWRRRPWRAGLSDAFAASRGTQGVPQLSPHARSVGSHRARERAHVRHIFDLWLHLRSLVCLCVLPCLDFLSPRPVTCRSTRKRGTHAFVISCSNLRTGNLMRGGAADRRPEPPYDVEGSCPLCRATPARKSRLSSSPTDARHTGLRTLSWEQTANKNTPEHTDVHAPCAPVPLTFVAAIVRWPIPG